MAQTVFNILGSDGYDVFQQWSARNPDHNEAKCWKLYHGLHRRADGRPTLSMGSILHLSQQANQEQYDAIRAKYAAKPAAPAAAPPAEAASTSRSYEAVKARFEQIHFMVEEPEPLYVRQRSRKCMPFTPSHMRTLTEDLFFEEAAK